MYNVPHSPYTKLVTRAAWPRASPCPPPRPWPALWSLEDEDPEFQQSVGRSAVVRELHSQGWLLFGPASVVSGCQQSKGMLNRNSFRFSLKFLKVIVWVAQGVSGVSRQCSL